MALMRILALVFLTAVTVKAAPSIDARRERLWVAAAADSGTDTNTTENSPPPPPVNACGDLMREVQQFQYQYASDVYACFQTVPFSPASATRLVRYWNDTIQFHSTLDHLKNPPEFYQKPAVDLELGLRQIQSYIDNGQYHNEYEFEADLQRLLGSAADAHLVFYGGITASFAFANPWSLTSLSVDGIALPEVYLSYDLYLNRSKGPQETWQPSPLTKINGYDVTEYLSNFAAMNAVGGLEPHADWNTLMDNPVSDVLGFWTVWSGGATFYPGDEIVFTCANGTEITDRWLAIYNGPQETGPLETGGDFFNFFVLGYWPASYNGSEVATTDASTDDSNTQPPVTSFSDFTSAFPQPDVYQQNLTDGNYVTGYFLHDEAVAVLSIPSFAATADSVANFAATVQQFLSEAKTKGMKKVVIDLQRNTGGAVLLAYSTFKQFFPSIDPFAGSNSRAHDLADLMGTVITQYWDSLEKSDELKSQFSADEWIVTDRINATTGEDFASWDGFYGPIDDGVGWFTRTQRLNYSDYDFAQSALQGATPPDSLFASTGDSPFAASDIIILSDAICSSTCAIFLEMMRYEANVQNIVIGGRPEYGPMQTPSGSRGARYYSLNELDGDIDNVAVIRNSTTDIPNRYDQDFWPYAGGVNLRSQIRENNTLPLQMIYEAADCRIFLTPNTYNNFTNLWKYTAAAAWGDQLYCVHDSTGYAGTQETPRTPPARQVPPGVNYEGSGVIALNGSATYDFALSPPVEPMPGSGGPPASLRDKPRLNSQSKPSVPAQNGKFHQQVTPNPRPRTTTQAPLRQGISYQRSWKRSARMNIPSTFV